MGGLGAGVVVAAMHPRHRALRVVIATAALAVAAAVTLAVLGQRTHLEAAEREAPMLVGVERERRLVHAASGASIPMPHELTPVPGTEDLAASVEDGDARSMIAWAWTTPGGVVSWTMTLLRSLVVAGRDHRCGHRGRCHTPRRPARSVTPSRATAGTRPRPRHA